MKRVPLAGHRVIDFATHGGVAGDVSGMAEPSLVPSIPTDPSGFGDGLLTSSEVAQLKLNADWVALSACHTIAGGKPGAEALHGLTRSLHCRRAPIVRRNGVVSRGRARWSRYQQRIVQYLRCGELRKKGRAGLGINQNGID